MQMNEVIDAVMSGKRLKKFAAKYALLFFCLTLAVSALKLTVPFFKNPFGSYLLTLFSLVIEAPLVYGLMRGIVMKDYRFSTGLSVFSKTACYRYCFLYVGLRFVYNCLNGAVSALAAAKGLLGILGWLLTVVVFVLGLALNFYLVKLFFEGIFSEETLFSPQTVGNDCYATLLAKPKRVIAAEAFRLVVLFVSTIISALLASLIPSHVLVSYALSCLNAVQYGFIIVSWPVYYLYYKDTFEM